MNWKNQGLHICGICPEYGMEELPDCLERNEQSGIVYHREGIMGDYDEFDDLEELIDFIGTGEKE